MKHLALVTILLMAGNMLRGQNIAINNSGNPADPSAILDISALDKGVLIPRMQTSERLAIVSPAQGLLVFDTITRSFWFYSNGWNEISSGGVISGPAGGDLNGNYPSPNVVRLQNHDVAPGTPDDMKVMKWYNPNARWQPMRDSLELPYDGVDSENGNLFSITNTFNGLSNTTAIHGQRIDPSGIPLGFSSAIWGDALVGTGILGTSSFHPGVYGESIQNHGVEGHAQAANKAGVYGTSSSASDAIGLLGEVNTPGTAIFGKANNDNAIAGRFDSPLTTNVYPTLISTNFGLGASASFSTGNASNANATVYVNTLSTGDGISAYHDTIGTDNAAVKAVHAGQGQGVYAKSHDGDAGKFVIDNLFSMGDAINASTIGDGGAGVFTKTHVFGEQTGDPAVLIDNYSRASALKVKSTYASATTAGIDVDYQAYGYGINVASTKGGVKANIDDAGSLAIYGNNGAEEGEAVRGDASNSTKGTGVRGNTSGFFGAGVLGTATGSYAYGVKGENASDGVGAVTGINSGSGGGVVGINQADFGYGVIGDSGPQHGVAGKFISSNATSAISPAIWALVQSLSNGIEVTMSNDNNDHDAINVSHHGVGNLMKLTSYNNGDVTVANNGNIVTSGRVTVAGNKGIVRNSSGTQMRYETKTSGTLVSGDVGVGVVGTLNITFSTTFGATPVVTIANVENVSGSVGQKLLANISNVTTTGCTITVINPYMNSTGAFSAKWTVMAIGAE